MTGSLPLYTLRFAVMFPAPCMVRKTRPPCLGYWVLAAAAAPARQLLEVALKVRSCYLDIDPDVIPLTDGDSLLNSA